MLEDNVAKLLAEFATAKQKKDDLQQQFEALTGGRVTSGYCKHYFYVFHELLCNVDPEFINLQHMVL